jgi:hemerythrin-like metal-binding protein
VPTKDQMNMTMSSESFKHYILGIPDIDKQHWQMFQIIALINDCFDPQVACHLVDALVDGWTSHRDIEERYMRLIKYPYVEAHLQDHDKMSAAALSLKKKIYEDVEIKGGKYYASKIEEMLRQHIDHNDRQFAVWGKEHPAS